MALSDAEQAELLDLARQIAGYRRISRSPLRHVGEGETETISGFEWNTDGNVHVLLVERLAELGDPDSLALLREVGNLDVSRYPDRAHDRLLAQAILNKINQQFTANTAPATGVTPGVTSVTPIAPAPAAAAPAVVIEAAPAPVAAASAPSGGGLYADISNLRNQIHDIAAALSTTTEGN